MVADCWDAAGGGGPLDSISTSVGRRVLTSGCAAVGGCSVPAAVPGRAGLVLWAGSFAGCRQGLAG